MKLKAFPEFKIGDKVTMIKERTKDLYHDELPDWYSPNTFTIIDVDMHEKDSFGYQIVTLKERINCKKDKTNRITTYYLKLSIKEERKLKLKKLYGTNINQSL